jgi:hypothetical protein
MGAENYTIKLYGHGSDNPKEFCNNLARVLDIPVGEAEELLSRAPVVVKRGMNKTDAEELYVRLQSIAAWCILEVPDRLATAEQRQEKSLYRFIAEDFREDDLSERYKGRPRLWFGILLGLTAFLGLFVLVGLMGSIGSIGTIGPGILPEKQIVTQSDQPEVSESETEELESPDVIQERIQQLQSSLRSLYARRTEIIESRDLPDAANLERELRNQIRAEYRELRVLKAKLGLGESEEQL